MMIQTTTKSGSIEKESLGTHVEMCALRHSLVDKRITEVENKISGIGQRNDADRSLIIKAIGAATAVISLAVTLAITFLTKLQ